MIPPYVMQDVGRGSRYLLYLHGRSTSRLVETFFHILFSFFSAVGVVVTITSLYMY